MSTRRQRLVTGVRPQALVGRSVATALAYRLPPLGGLLGGAPGDGLGGAALPFGAGTVGSTFCGVVSAGDMGAFRVR